MLSLKDKMLGEDGLAGEAVEAVRGQVEFGRAWRSSSATALPTAGDCMKPWPEKPHATYTPSPTRPIIGCASGVMSYSPAHARTTGAPAAGG